MSVPNLSWIADAAAAAEGLQLLVLHGSRARGDARNDSDWDFGYLAHSGFDPDALLARLSGRLGDTIDMADLNRASALLRFKAAAEGVAEFEARPRLFDEFRSDSIRTWCDMEPVLSRAYAAEAHTAGAMRPIDRALIAERSAAVERHLDRVAARLPADAATFKASTDESDAVILHLWQATQGVIDLALAACVQLRYGAPSTYAGAFRLLEEKGVIDGDLSDRLVKAAGFRNLVAHAYDTLDMARVHRAATEGPRDLRAFLKSLARHVQ